MQKIIVDMTPGHRMPTIYFSQGDVGTQFAIDLRSRFGNSLPASPTITIQATKPSGFGFSVSATSLTNGVAVFTTTAEMTDEAGYFPAELKVVKDSVTLFTANFNMAGKATTHPEGTIDGSAEEVIPELTQLVERVEDAASSVLDMTVEAETLAAGSQATYSYDEETNTATFGIPQGEAGAGAAGVTASAYSSSKTYAVGDYVIHNSNLYRCTTAITTAESFTAAHWTQVVLADDVSDLKSDLEYTTESDLFDGEYRQGYINGSGGYSTSSSGKSYAFDIQNAVGDIHVKLKGNNALVYGFYSATRENVTSASVAEKYESFSSPFPKNLTFDYDTYHNYKTLIITSDYNNGTPAKVYCYDAEYTKKQLAVELSQNLISGIRFSAGSISASNGAPASSNERIRTESYVQEMSGVLSSNNTKGRFYVYAWESGVYKGGLVNGEIVANSSTLQQTVDFEQLHLKYPTYHFKFVYLLSSGAVTLANVSDLTLTNVIYPKVDRASEKIRVSFNNVGLFNFGSKVVKMSTADALQKMENYKQFYAEYQPNIIAMEEFPDDDGVTTPYIDTNESVAPNNDLYPYIYPYSSIINHYAIVKSDYTITEERSVAEPLAGFDYSLRGIIATIKTPENRAVGVMSTVFDVNGTAANRTAQMTKAIELLGSFNWAILCVDTNMLSQSEYDAMVALFENNSYQVVNGGFYPLTDTCPAAEYKPIDNIFVKGDAKIKSFIVPQVISTLASDHLPVIADITLYG